MTGESNMPERVREVELTLDLLADFWLKHPELRLGQVVENARRMIDDPGTNAYYLDDGALRAGLDVLRREYP